MEGNPSLKFQHPSHKFLDLSLVFNIITFKAFTVTLNTVHSVQYETKCMWLSYFKLSFWIKIVMNGKGNPPH